MMAVMAKQLAHVKKVKNETVALLRDRGAQSWSVKPAILKGFDLARGRHQEVHPPCKATWSTPQQQLQPQMQQQQPYQQLLYQHPQYQQPQLQ